MFFLSPSYSKESIPMEFSSSVPSSNHLVGNRHQQKALAESAKNENVPLLTEKNPFFLRRKRDKNIKKKNEVK